ncbi:MAG: polyketide cyclase [Pedosphaera sp.]|nr:polyketide cyclase [Pedosphaera sp.]
MLIKILIAIATVIVVFAIIVAMRPSEFRITRTAAISAVPAVVFEQVNDLHKWEAWSPWAKMDPTAKISFEGPPAGTGAGYDWVGNSKVGEGHMTITESRPVSLIRFRLDFRKPFAGTNTAEFAFKPEGSQTVVTWSMTGKYNFIMKAMGIFMSCDKMIGSHFEKGLADLNTVAKAASKETAATVTK